MVNTRGLLAGLALTAVVAGCGSGDEQTESSGLSADEQRAADNLAAQIVRSGSVSGQSTTEDAVTEQQATCVAEGAVSEVGLDSLQGYGILTDELLVDKSIQGVQMVAADADALAGVFVECIDAEALFEERFVQTASEPTDDVRSCVEDAVDEESVREILAASFRGRSTAAFGELQRAVDACTQGSAGSQ